MLALALAFNDIKDVSWVHEQLKKCESDDAGRPEKRRGQWIGMNLAFARFNAGFMTEVGNCIEKADELGLLRTPAFKSAQERARQEAPASVAAWDDLVDAFQTNPIHGRRHPLAKYLKRVRNWSFHYGQDKNFKTLAAGYRGFFDAPARPDGANLRAFVSLGDTQETTRFFQSVLGPPAPSTAALLQSLARPCSHRPRKERFHLSCSRLLNRNPWNTPATIPDPTMSPRELIAAARVKVAPGRSMVLNCPSLSR